jgi:hypothetical protein
MPSRLFRHALLICLICLVCMSSAAGQTCSSTTSMSTSSVQLSLNAAPGSGSCVFPAIYYFGWTASTSGVAQCYDYFDCGLDQWLATPLYTSDYHGGSGALCFVGFSYLYASGTVSVSSCGTDAYVWEWGQIFLDLPWPGPLHYFGRTICQPCTHTALHWTD